MDEQEVLKAVEQYVHKRHAHLSPSNVVGWDEEDLERGQVDGRGYLVFTVEDLHIEETEEDENVGKIWYVAATLHFQVTEGEPLESDENVYEAYMGTDNEWCIQWDHC